MNKLQELANQYPDKTIAEAPSNYEKDYRLAYLAEPVITDSTIEWFTLIPLNETEKADAEAYQKGMIHNTRKAAFVNISWMYERAAREARLGQPATIPIEKIDQSAEAWANITDQEGYPWDVVFPKMPNQL